MKIILIVIDGLGDEPIPQLGNKTPLEAANTPNLDLLAKEGVCGLVEPFFRDAIPTSEETHLAILGFNAADYQIRRGLFTALGAGIEVRPGDVALRGNLATVDENLNVINRRAGRIKNPQPFIEALEEIKIDKVDFLIKSATEHRLGIVMRAEGLSPNISDGDPFYSKLEEKVQKISPLDESKEAQFTARVLNQFLEKAHQDLKSHPENKKREELGLLPANYILTRGASSVKELPSFEEKYGLTACCIAGKLLYQQIGKILGMELIKVEGATGLPDTNLKEKVEATKKALRKYDFVFLHIKATDSLAEDGDFLGKKEFIEKIDKNLKGLMGLKNTLIVVTCDHSTCSLLKRHCKRPCPVLIYPPKFFGKKLRRASEVKEFTRLSFAKQKLGGFSERACQRGKLGTVRQLDLMPIILNNLKVGT